MPPKRSVTSRTDSSAIDAANYTFCANKKALANKKAWGVSPALMGDTPESRPYVGLRKPISAWTSESYGRRGADSAASPIAHASRAAATPTNTDVTSCGLLTVATTRPRWL